MSDEKIDAKTESPTATSVDYARGSISHDDQDFDEDEEVEVDWRTWMAAISGMSCVYSGYYTGIQSGNVAGPTTAAFGTPNLATWMPNEFAIFTAAIAGLVGSCSDQIGRKWILIGGIAICCLGQIIMAAAPNMAAELVGAGMIAGIFVNQGNFFSIPAEVLPRRYRGLGATMTVSAGGLGSLTGIMFSAATIQNNTLGLGWRSTWIFGAGINLMAIALVFTFYRPIGSPKKAGESTFTALKKVDWLGAFLLATGIGLIMIGLVMGGVTHPWQSSYVIGTLVGGAATLIILAVHQLFINKHGILDHDLWTRNFCVASFGCFVEGIVFYSVLLFFPLETATFWESRAYFQNVRLLLFFVTSAVFSPFVGWYTRITKDLKWPLLAGWALVFTGFVILATADQDSNTVSMGGLFLVGAGFSVPLALLFACAQLATAPHLLGLTTGQLIGARGFGQTIGASVFVAIYQAKVKAILPGEVAAAATEAGLSAKNVPAFVAAVAAGNTTLIEAVPGINGKIIKAGSVAATESLVKSFHYGWESALPFAIVALLLVLLLDGQQIKRQMTWLVERPVTVIHHVAHDEEKEAGGRRSSLITGRRASANSAS